MVIYLLAQTSTLSVLTGTIYQDIYYIRDQRENSVSTEVKEIGLTIQLSSIIPAEGQMVSIKEKN